MNLTPTIIELEDGTVGYFYSPQQLEEYRMHIQLQKVERDLKKYGNDDKRREVE